jgi:hypothetical protein
MCNYVQILDHFNAISLKEMDSVQLMNRTDTKFIFNVSHLNDILNSSCQNYRVLEINAIRDFSYHTTYLDTKNYYFLNQYLLLRPNRHKVRYRIYEVSGLSFIEVKCKTAKDRTLKYREENKLTDSRPDEKAVKFLTKHIGCIAESISPVLVNRFQRITLVNLVTKERITLDYNISFSDRSGILVELPKLAIAEIKSEGSANQSPFISILKKKLIRQTGFSKYSVGLVLLKPMAKANILKEKLLILKKIENDPINYSGN